MDWNFGVNLFETTTRRRFPAMDALLADHYHKCRRAVERSPGDPDFPVMLARVELAQNAWSAAMVALMGGRGLWKARTQTIRKLIAQLRGEHIGRWVTMVSCTDVLQGTYMPGSPGHLRLFPHGRRPFQQGSTDSRIAAVRTLAASLAAVPAMSAVARLVSAFYSAINTAREEQQDAEGGVSGTSSHQESRRRAAAIALQKNLGRLIEKYAETPDKIMDFFDLKDVKAPRRSEKAMGA